MDVLGTRDDPIALNGLRSKDSTPPQVTDFSETDAFLYNIGRDI